KQQERQKPGPSDNKPHIGIAVAELTPDLAQQLGIPSSVKGVIIGDIEEGSAAAEAGLQVGDVIQEVNHQPIRKVTEFQAQLQSAGSDPMLVVVNREGHHLFFALESR